jgi:hypothetical protein
MLRYVSAGLIVAVSAGLAPAAVNSVTVDSADVPEAVLSGHVKNDVMIDFAGQLTGNQMVVDLEQGSIFQAGTGGNGAPNGALFSAVPELEYDTFLTSGGLTQSGDEGTNIANAGAAGLPAGSADRTFDSAGIDVLWFPSAGTTVADRDDFTVARVTLTADAQGSWSYLGATDDDGAGTPFGTYAITDGVMTIPEPTTLAILGLGGGAMLIRRRR